MNQQIEIMNNTRKYILGFLNDLSLEQLNEVPPGFNNNIIWNIGHLIAVQQAVVYLRAGLPLKIEKHYFLAYKPDSKPEQFIGEEEVKTIKQLLLSTINQFATDYEQNIFGQYKSWTTRYGVDITNIDDALNFLPYHEGLHLGYIMALKRLVTTKNS